MSKHFGMANTRFKEGTFGYKVFRRPEIGRQKLRKILSHGPILIHTTGYLETHNSSISSHEHSRDASQAV